MGGLTNDDPLIDAIRTHAHPLTGDADDFSPLLRAVSGKSIVLLGTATHGTHEFYRARFEITRRLIEEQGFSAIALEADWPDCQRVDRYIRKHELNIAATEGNPEDALESFQKFPMWMWRNRETVELIEWLQRYNDHHDDHNIGHSNRHGKTPFQARIFGIDLFNLYASIRQVIAYLDRADPEAADRARRLYSCFDYMDKNPARYGRHVRVGTKSSCENEVVQVLEDLLEREARATTGDPRAHEELFFARQNAETVRAAEIYYRNLFNPLVNTWNIRDRHMSDMVENILSFLESQGRSRKIVIWAHNSHIGDCRATEMNHGGQWNLGQLLRLRFPGQTYHVGFTTYEGRVQAASRWDRPSKWQVVRAAIPGSYEELFHRTAIGNFALETGQPGLVPALNEERFERAIGIVYSPDADNESIYLRANIANQFDAIVHFDNTTGVIPLDRAPRPEVAPPSEIQF